MKLASFDIFDTVLIRKCGKPANIFYLLAKRLFPGNDARAAAFIAWRKQAEKTACRKYGCENVTFEQIYDSFDEQGLGLNREETAAIEKETEFSNLIANPQLKEIIERKRDEGYCVCFISDMYLDSGFLREVLDARGLIRPQEEVFVSCEWNCRKPTGKLFGIVKEKYRPEQWEHYGDNYHGDYLGARKHGVQAVRIDTGYTPAEEFVEKKYAGHRFYPELSIFTGFQRAARITQGNTSFAEMAADFVAPVYIAYVLFTLRQAQKHGIKRLYFVNRDGYILLKIAEMFAGQYSEIELRYIFISRKSIVLPSLVRTDPDLLLETMQSGSLIGQRVTGLLNHLDIDREDLRPMGITFPYDRITNAAEEEDFLNKLFGSGFTPLWEEKISRSKRIFKQYLDQEGVTDGVKSAMVDLGWYGSTRLMLNRILDHYVSPRVSFFYVSVTSDPIPASWGEYFTYLPYIEDVGIVCLMEQYFSACPYGSTVSYAEQNDKIVPVLEDHVLTEGYDRIVSENVEVVEKIASYMKEVLQLRLDRIPELAGVEYLQVMKDQRVRINLEACSQAGSFADPMGAKNAFVRKITLPETIRYVGFGLRVTAFDKASVAFTYGRRTAKALFRCHERSAQVARFAYRKYLVYRQKKNNINGGEDNK